MSSHDKYWDREQVKRLSGGYVASKKRHDTIALYIKRNSSTSNSKPKVLNIGVGNGYLEEVLIAAGYDVFCLDPSESAIAKIGDKLGIGKESCRVGGVESIPFDSGSFDFVVMSEVIEHLEDDVLHKGLEEVRRVLRESGTLLGTVPCNEDLTRETFRCPSCMQSFHRVGHVTSYLPKDMKDLLSRYFSILVCHRFLGMHLNWKGYLLHQWNDFPFKFVRLIRPNVRAPHQIEFNIFFAARKVSAAWPSK